MSGGGPSKAWRSVFVEVSALPSWTRAGVELGTGVSIAWDSIFGLFTNCTRWMEPRTDLRVRARGGTLGRVNGSGGAKAGQPLRVRRDQTRRPSSYSFMF